MFLLTALSALSPSHASDTEVWANTRVGVAANPGGLISDTRVQLRKDLSDSDHILLQDTYAGAGFRAAVTPAFAEVGPRLSIAPLAIFDLDLQASYIGYFPGNVGLMPFDSPVDTTERARNEREDGFGSHALALSATPTLKAKVDRLVVVNSTTVSYLAFQRPDDVTSAFTYEPYRDLVVAFEDVTIENQALGLIEFRDDDKAMARIGGTVRYRAALRSQDTSTAAGAIAMVRPGAKSPTMPTLVGQMLFYVDDIDREPSSRPNIALMASWDL